MASYNVILKPSVEKDLRSLPAATLKRVFKRIEALEDDPCPRGSLKLAGAEQLYRIRVGDYRQHDLKKIVADLRRWEKEHPPKVVDRRMATPPLRHRRTIFRISGNGRKGNPVGQAPPYAYLPVILLPPRPLRPLRLGHLLGTKALRLGVSAGVALVLSDVRQDAGSDGLGEAVLPRGVAVASGVLDIREVAELDQDGRTAGVDEDLVFRFADAVTFTAGGSHRQVDLAGSVASIARGSLGDVDRKTLKASVGVGVGMDADEKVGVAAVRNIRPLFQLDEPIVLPRHHDPDAALFEEAGDSGGYFQIDAFLVHAARADCAWIVPAVTGVNDDHRPGLDWPSGDNRRLRGGRAKVLPDLGDEEIRYVERTTFPFDLADRANRLAVDEEAAVRMGKDDHGISGVLQDDERSVPLFDPKAKTQGQVLDGRNMLADHRFWCLFLWLLATGEGHSYESQSDDGRRILVLPSILGPLSSAVGLPVSNLWRQRECVRSRAHIAAIIGY